MSAQDYSQIVIGGPCKIIDGAAVIYTEGAVTLDPEFTDRKIPSSVGGEQDDVLVDLIWKIGFTPKSVWNAATRAALLPDAYFNFATTGARIIGAVNRAVNIIGADAQGFDLTRAKVTKPPDLYLGIGNSLYGAVEYTAFLGQGKLLSDADAFMVPNTTAWDQSDFPTSHQEAECFGAWSGQTGWDNVFAEEGFKLAHELQLETVKQGNITVDKKVTGYRAMLSFKPQQPTTAQLLAGLSTAIGARRSGNAHDFVAAGSGISVTVASAALHKGNFTFDNKINRHGEWAMITALTAPGNRLTFA